MANTSSTGLQTQAAFHVKSQQTLGAILHTMLGEAKKVAQLAHDEVMEEKIDQLIACAFDIELIEGLMPHDMMTRGMMN